jgi:hypothetical protein
MANGLSDFLENKILNLVLKNTAYAPPSTIYLSLHTADPTDTGSIGAEITTTGTNYARENITAKIGTVANGSVTTSADILFPVATANYGTVTHLAIWDAVSAGNMLFSGALGASKVINSGDQFKIAASNLTITLD